MNTRPYQKLIVWREAHALFLRIHAATEKFPAEEKFRLTNQMRKSAYSVPMNIAEGSGKASHKEREHFYETAACSLDELHCQSLLARDVGYITQDAFTQMDDHIQRVSYLLTNLRRALHLPRRSSRSLRSPRPLRSPPSHQQ